MPIVRRIYRSSYTSISNHLANDPNLSFEDRGLLLYLLSKPHDWSVAVKDLIRAGNVNEQTGRNFTGRDKVYEILKRLEQYGYVERTRVKAKDGRFQGFEYLVAGDAVPQGLPFPAFQEMDAPLPDLPDVVSPDTEKPDAYKEPNKPNNDSYKKQSPNKCGFDELISRWCQVSLPDNRNLARSLFDDLPTEGEREAAVQCAPVFCQRNRCQGKEPHLIPYLKQHAWRELNGAPEIDQDGLFIITPDREEWEPWLDHIASTIGTVARRDAEQEGRIARITRFPPIRRVA